VAVAVAGDRGPRPISVGVPHPVLPLSLPRSLPLPLPLVLRNARGGASHR
jgi:hypothetical protein